MESETPPRSVSDSIALFSSDRIRTEGLDSCFDAFSSREPVSTSLENAIADAHSLRRFVPKYEPYRSNCCTAALTQINLTATGSHATNKRCTPSGESEVIEERHEAGNSRPGLCQPALGRPLFRHGQMGHPARDAQSVRRVA